MKSLWSDDDAPVGDDLTLRAYTARLLGAEATLVLHGGGNTSMKGTARTFFGDPIEALFVKASGTDLATLGPEGHVACDLALLRRLEALATVDDASLTRLLRATLLDPSIRTPSIEALVHALLPPRFVDHTHADAVLALTNRPDGEAVVRRALGEAVIVLPYVEPGLELARASAAAFRAQPLAIGMVWLKHGLVTWGETARESYERTIELVTRAEAFLGTVWAVRDPPPPRHSAPRLVAVAPLVRAALALPKADGGWVRMIVRSLADPAELEALALPEARRHFENAPLTGDHLIRTGRRPLWLEETETSSPERLRETLAREVARYANEERQLTQPADLGEQALELTPRVVLVQGAGALAAGFTAREAGIAADITRHTLAVKCSIADAGASYEGLSHQQATAMLYRGMQVAKLASSTEPLAGTVAPLAGTVALVTGAAGAIGAGICRVLAEAGACVAVTDLPGAPLEGLGAELAESFPHTILTQPLDVTDPASVASAFDAITLAWGGVDLVVANAGAAHVARLEELELEAFRRLERINSEGTLTLLSEAMRRFRHQGTGGDIVLVSTKNVFAPGAGFGAYSATKAAAHQLARIASLEGAELDVRVNMVAPDAVFAEGERKSGLWQEVGPARMKARGLDEAGLEEYYRSRNLLKVKITARHVGQAVLFFAERKTPTTGATLPVDGGLPEATPR